jgi:hypothetical protein
MMAALWADDDDKAAHRAALSSSSAVSLQTVGRPKPHSPSLALRLCGFSRRTQNRRMARAVRRRPAGCGIIVGLLIAAIGIIERKREIERGSPSPSLTLPLSLSSLSPLSLYYIYIYIYIYITCRMRETRPSPSWPPPPPPVR